MSRNNHFRELAISSLKYILEADPPRNIALKIAEAVPILIPELGMLSQADFDIVVEQHYQKVLIEALSNGQLAKVGSLYEKDLDDRLPQQVANLVIDGYFEMADILFPFLEENERLFQHQDIVLTILRFNITQLSIPIINWLEKNVIPDFFETAEGDEDFEVMLADIRDEIEGYMASPNFDSDVADWLIKTFDFNGHSMGFWRPASLPAYQRMIGRVSGICNKEDWLTPFLMQLYIDQMEKNVAQRNQTEIAETLAVLRLVMNHCGYSLKIITEEMKNIGYKSRDVAMISDILKGRQLK